MKKIIKDTNLVPVNINDLVLDSAVSEGSMNPPTSDAVAAAIAGGGSPDVYIAEYNVTPYDDIDAAIQANKSVFVKYTISDGTFELFPFVLQNEGVPSPFIIFQGFYDAYHAQQVKVTKNISDGTTTWSIARYVYQSNTLFDSSLTYSYNDITHTGSLSVTNPLPSSSAADADKVLTVDSQGAPGWAQASGGSTGYTRRAIGTVTDTDNLFSVTLNNKECATVELSPSNTSRKNLLVTVANDCDDAILHYTVTNQSTKMSNLRVMRGNTDLTIITPPTIKYGEHGGLLRSLLEGESDYEVPTDWSDVECSSALTSVDGVELSHIDVSGKYDVVLRIVADFCFLHPLAGDQEIPQ